MVEIVWAVIFDTFRDISPARIIESVIFITVLMVRLRPHLNKMEARMLGLETGLQMIQKSVAKGFSQGDSRFSKIETRLNRLESKRTIKLPEVTQ